MLTTYIGYTSKSGKWLLIESLFCVSQCQQLCQDVVAGNDSDIMLIIYIGRCNDIQQST